MAVTSQQVILPEDKIRQMQEEVIFTANPVSESQLLLILIKRIPFLADLLNTMDSTTAAIGQLVQVTGNNSTALANAMKGLAITGVVFDSINFFRIPLIYIASWAVGEKPPISLSNNAKWLYAGVLVGLGLAALLVPEAGTILAVTTALLVAGVSTFALGRLLWQRHQFKKEGAALAIAINTDLQELSVLKAQAAQLEIDLATGHDPEGTKNQINALEVQFLAKKEKIQALLDQKQVAKAKLEKRDWSNVLDKSVGIILAAIVVVGIITSVFFPAAGLIILAVSGFSALAYLLGRITIPLLNKLVKRFKGVVDQEDLVTVISPAVNNAPNISVSPIDSASPQLSRAGSLSSDNAIPNSTANTARSLFGANAAPILQSSIVQDEGMDKLDEQLAVCVQHHNLKGILDVFKEVARQAQSVDDIQLWLDSGHNADMAISLLQQAVDKVVNSELTYASDDIAELLASNALRDVLTNYHLSLDVMTTEMRSSSGREVETQLLSNQEDESESASTAGEDRRDENSSLTT